MGPGKDFKKGFGVMNPPVFESDQDLLSWRKKVASWVDLIATAAEKGEDKFYKTVFHTLGRQLYDRVLRQAQQSRVDEAQEQGKIYYKQEDQVKAVQEIVDLIAQDPPIFVVTRLIDSFNMVTSCMRKYNEDLNHYVCRFRGLAAEHLMKVGSTSQSQIGEVLEITMLNNASLSEASFTNAKLRLIGMAKERSKGTIRAEKKFTLTLDEAQKRSLSITKLAVSIARASGSSSRTGKLSIRKATGRFNDMCRYAKPIFDNIKKLNGTRDIAKPIAFSGRRCTLSLDDAVDVLRSLAHTTNKTEASVIKAQIESAVNNRVRSFFGSQENSQRESRIRNQLNYRAFNGKKRKTYGNDGDNYKSDRDGNRKKSTMLAELVGEACMDCGRKDHARGDLKCQRPSYATLKIREAKDRHEEDSERNRIPENFSGYFRPGSKHSKGKGAW